ncbi:MAG: alpha-L-fucosidase [Candidatus Neomarinimicrobiota bacterium]
MNKLQRNDHLAWWQVARFGMFVHWGLYSRLGRHEWVMNKERIPVADYERLADDWQPAETPARNWARLARESGMKYLVFTTKHHDGYCLWDTAQTEYNSVRRGPGRDLVREFVEAGREFDLKIGFYYSLMDWHHPDGANCANDEAARRRFVDFTHGCVRELMTNYGKIDILWYDVPWPLPTATAWESTELNSMVRTLQPQILINDRAMLPEDFSTPEEAIRPAEADRPWESCMTFNGAWGCLPYAPPEDWHSARKVLSMLQQVTAGGGNLLLNIGPAPDGSVPPEALERLATVGRWLKQNGAALYGGIDRNDDCFEVNPLGAWTRKGNTAYFWCDRWPGGQITLAGFKTKLDRATLLANGTAIRFEQTGEHLRLLDLPAMSPDRIAGITVVKLEFAAVPRQELGFGYVLLP